MLDVAGTEQGKDYDMHGFGFPHRDLISNFVDEPKMTECRMPFNVLIARPAGSSERLSTPRAKAAMDTECVTLRNQVVWDRAALRLALRHMC